MHVVCVDPDLRAWLSDTLDLADAAHESIVVAGTANSVHPYFGTPDTADNAVVALKDLAENNLKYAIRYMLTNAEKPIKLAIVSEDWSETHIERLEQVIRTEYRRAENNNLAEIQKANNLKESEWKLDRLNDLHRWRTIPTFQYATYRKTTCLKEELYKYFQDTTEESSSFDGFISTKAPILHWTATPLDGELQLVVRFTFPLYGPDGSLLRNIADRLRPNFDIMYQWTQGVLLTCEPVRVHVQLLTPTRLEVAARICVDELEGMDAVQPTAVLWPYVSLATRHTLSELRKNPYIQYSNEFVVFGSSLFRPPIECRVFDLPLFMTTAQEYGKVAFRNDDQLYEVLVDQVFPGSVPRSMEELVSQTPSLPQPKINGFSSAILNMDKVTPLESASLSSSLQVHHNRGRRVSFGTIRCMDGEGSVDEYVDGILKQTLASIQSEEDLTSSTNLNGI